MKSRKINKIRLTNKFFINFKQFQNMRKAKFILVALVAVVVAGIAYAVKVQVPELNQKGYLYNPATDQYVTSEAVMGDEGLEFVISDFKDCGSSFGSDDASIEEAGYTYVRFKFADGSNNFMRMTKDGVVCQSSGYHKWAVKDTGSGLVIRCIYTSTQSSGALNPFAKQGYYLTPGADGKLVLLEEPADESYWQFVSPEDYQDRLENEANAVANLPKLIKKAQQILDKPMSKTAKTALETALATYGEGYTGKAFPAALAIAEAYDDAAASVVAYKGIQSSIEMHRQLLSGDELAEFEERIADIVDDLENGVIDGNGIDEMAEIAKIAAAIEGTSEALEFAYETECEVNKNYLPGADHGITVDWDAIAEALGVEKDGLKIYAVMGDGTLDETYGRGSAGTDGWRNAEGNWAGWNSADNLFYVQFDGLDLVGVGCMRTAEPIKYTAEFKVVSAAETEGKSVTLKISLNVKAKEIDNTVPTTVDELTVASTLKQVVTLPIGASYVAAKETSANVDDILAALGETSFDNVKIFAVKSDGTLDAEYKLGTTDGWRNADGDWAGWSDASSQFYVKADFTRAEGQLYEIGCHPEHSGVHMTDVVNYTAQYAFVVGGKSENKSVLYNVVVAIAPEAADLDITGATAQYFYNVEAKGFLLGANNWETRASIGSKGFDMHFEANGDTYKLCAINNTGAGRPGNDLDCSAPGEIWVDGAGRGGSGMWTFKVNADGSFTIANNNVPGLLSAVGGGDTKLYMSEDPAAMSTWIAVSAETYQAFSNKAQLAEEAATLAEIKALIDGTNFYTKDAYEAYYKLYEDAITKNAAGEVVGNLDNPSKVHGWHAANEYDNYLLSAWTINGEQANEFDKALYINTWSVEADGKENSSGMHVPFFEYWTGDDNSLGATVIEGTVKGLVPGTYAVRALARVRIKNNGGDEAKGIVFTANGSEPVDIANGRTCGDGDQFRWTLVMVNGVKVADDGVLKVAFNVLEDNNISWLSFKDVNYMYATTPIVGADEVTAIDEVNAKPAAPKTIFSVAGQQMKNLQKGLNIVDGKKVYVK